MKLLVTGSAGHLGEGLVRYLQARDHDVLGLDRVASPFTAAVGSICDRALIRRSLAGVEAVLHTATLHKPHVATHRREAFVATNVTGTLVLLEEAVRAGVGAFVFTSTTSAFGHALAPAAGAPATWVTEDLAPRPKNIYGATKVAAEDLCQLVHQDHGLPCVVLRTARFFPEADDSASARAAFDDANLKSNEYLHRRVDLADVVEAHALAMTQAPTLGFGRYVLSATTPFTPADLDRLRHDAPGVVAARFPTQPEVYARLGWQLPPGITRVYVNAKARAELGWQPRYGFAPRLEMLAAGEDPRSPLARAVGRKGYHAERFVEGPYPVAPET